MDHFKEHYKKLAKKGTMRGLIAELGEEEQMKRNHLNLIRPENTLKYLVRQRNLHNIPHKIQTIPNAR